MSEPPSSPQDDDPSLEASLANGLQRQPLDKAAFDRIRAAAEAEFVEQYGCGSSAPSRRMRTAQRFALAAAILVAVLLAVGSMVRRPPDVAMGSVLRTEHGNLEGGRIEWLPHHALEAGAPLHVGDSYTSDGTTLIALSGGGTLRVAPGSAFEVSADAEVLLNSGRVYLDFPRGVDGFVLRTSTGTVEHIGTQYEVTALARGMRVRVREGSVSVHTLNGVQPAEAGTEIVVYADEVVRQPVPTYGPEWKWAESIAPEFDIEDQPLADFLNWVARETGRRIVFADDRTRQLATETRLHGSIDGLNPSQALERVLSTTTLRCDVQENVIRVSSSR